MKISKRLLTRDRLLVMVFVQDEKIMFQFGHQIEEVHTILKVLNVDLRDVDIVHIQVMIDEKQKCFLHTG